MGCVGEGWVQRGRNIAVAVVAVGGGLSDNTVVAAVVEGFVG